MPKRPASFGMQYIIMLLLSLGSLHGYAIINLLRLLNLPGVKPSPGSVYPILRNLEEEKLVEVEQRGRRKYYKLTERGKGYLKAEVEVMLSILRFLEELHLTALKKLESVPEDREEIEDLLKDISERMRRLLEEVEKFKRRSSA